MKDEDIKDLVVKHDHAIDMLVQSIEHMVSQSSATNSKLDDVATAITTQNVMAEKFKNMHDNVGEAFVRYDDRIKTLEGNQVKGCGALSAANGQCKIDLGKVKGELKLEIKDTYERGTKEGNTRLRIGLVAGISVCTFLFGYLYVDLRAHLLEDRKLHTEIAEEKAVHKYLQESTLTRLDAIEDTLLEVTKVAHKNHIKTGVDYE